MQLLDRVDRFRQERNSGRGVYEFMTSIEWEALLIWDEMIEQAKRQRETALLQLIGSLVAR